MLKALALDNFWSPFTAKSKIKVIKKEGVASLRVWLAAGLIVANAALLMSYVYGVNEYASQGYQITSLKKQLSELTQSNNKITLQVSEASSMVTIQNDYLSANFVPAGTPKFLQESQNRLTER